VLEHVFDTGWVIEPAEPSPPASSVDDAAWLLDLDEPLPDEVADLDPLRPPLTGQELARFQELLDREDHTAAPGWAVPGIERGDGDDGLSGASQAALTEVGAAWEGLRRAQARCYRALVGLDASDAVAESGYRSLSRLLADHLRINPDEALRLDRHAHSLTPTVSPTGAPVPAELPATAALVAAGIIGPAHVEVIRRTLRRLAGVVPALDPDLLATTETQLAELATTHTPAALAEAATAILALLDPDGTAPDDDPPPENELHYLRRRDGALTGKFVYRDPAAAETLHTALSAATPPDPTLGVTDDPEPGRPRRGPNPEALAALTLPERRAHALLDLATEALTHGLNTTDSHEDTAVRYDDTDNEDDADRTTAEDIHADDRDSAGHGTEDAHADAEPDDGAGRPGADDSDAEDDSDECTGADDEGADGEVISPGGNGAAGAAARPPNARTGTGRPGTRRPPDPPPGPPAWTRADLEGGDPVALTLTLNYDTLRAALTPDNQPGHATTGYTGQLGLLGENTWIRPDTARRLACDAEIIPAVLGPSPLWRTPS
jgi:hypothetical protein